MFKMPQILLKSFRGRSDTGGNVNTDVIIFAN